MQIVGDQLRILKSSGLYEASENIFAGCLGSRTELNELRKILLGYPKIIITYHSENHKEYEFATLKLMQQKAHEETESFYGFYFHVKGVSWPVKRNPRAFIGGTYWRNYMEHFNIRKWKDCVSKLDEGFDTCGVKLLAPKESPANAQHYSGNFFWAKSEYIRTLKPIESLNHNDRFQAEFWQCSGSPNAATLCQDFVDYHAKGKFTPPA